MCVYLYCSSNNKIHSPSTTILTSSPMHIPFPSVQTLLLIHFATTAGRIGGFVVPGLLTGLAAVAIAELWLLWVVVGK